MKTVVIGAAAGYDWPEIEPWAVSLSRVYTGDKVVICHGLTDSAKENLNRLGFILVASSLPCAGNFFVGAGRHLEVWKFLRARDYDYVVFTDVRDVIFQRSPIDFWLGEIVVTSGSVTHRNEPWSLDYLKTCFPEAVDLLIDEELINGGVISGWSYSVQKLLMTMYCIARPLASFKWGIDQTVLNLALRNSNFAFEIRPLAINCCVISEPSRESEYRVHWLYDQPIVKNELVCSPYEVPYPIVHQYDRNPEFKKLILEKYREATLANHA